MMRPLTRYTIRVLSIPQVAITIVLCCCWYAARHAWRIGEWWADRVLEAWINPEE